MSGDKRRLAAPSLPVTKFAKEGEVFSISKMHRRRGAVEKRPGGVPGCRQGLSAGGT